MELDKLMQDQEFRVAIEKASSLDEIAEILQVKGIEVTSREIENAFCAEPGEMSETELETVSGGGLYSRVWSLINAIRYKAGSGGFSTGGGGNGGFGGDGIGGSR